jgi:hypothetical protein
MGASSKRDLFFVQWSNTKSRREKQGDPDIDVLPHGPRKPSTPKDGVVATSLPDSRERRRQPIEDDIIPMLP